jgi:hypothetical protein
LDVIEMNMTTRVSTAIMVMFLIGLVSSTFVIYSAAVQSEMYAENANCEEHEGTEEHWHHQDEQDEHMHNHMVDMHHKECTNQEEYHHQC